jgi:hypothetical protein
MRNSFILGSVACVGLGLGWGSWVRSDDASLQTQCLQAFKNNLYDLTYGKRIYLCEQASSAEGVSALNIVAITHKSISDNALKILLKITHPSSSQCLREFTSHFYDVTYGKRIPLCAQVTEGKELAALDIVVATTKGITDENFEILLKFNNPYSLQCLQSFTSHNYDVTFGKRIALCAHATCKEGIMDLNLITETTRGISDLDLETILKKRCG